MYSTAFIALNREGDERARSHQDPRASRTMNLNSNHFLASPPPPAHYFFFCIGLQFRSLPVLSWKLLARCFFSFGSCFTLSLGGTCNDSRKYVCVRRPA